MGGLVRSCSVWRRNRILLFQAAMKELYPVMYSRWLHMDLQSFVGAHGCSAHVKAATGYECRILHADIQTTSDIQCARMGTPITQYLTLRAIRVRSKCGQRRIVGEMNALALSARNAASQ